MPKKKKDVKQFSSDEELYSHIDNLMEDSINQTSTWRDSQDKWHRLRMRIKKTKTFPFIGCANVRMPTAEIKIRKLKSSIAKVIFGVRPIVQAIPSPSGNLATAQKIEKFIDHLIMDVMDYKSKGIITIDQSIEKGFYLNKPYWRKDITTRQETMSPSDFSLEEISVFYDPQLTDDMLAEILKVHFDVDMKDDVAENNTETLYKIVSDIRQGRINGVYYFDDIVYNAPDVALCNPEFVYVLPDSGYDVQGLRMITDEFFMPYDKIKDNVYRNGKEWSREALDTIDFFKSMPKDSLTEQTKDVREGIDRVNNPSQLVKIWETHFYYDINNDGNKEKAIVYSAPDFGVIFKKMGNPLFNNKFPFVKFYNELCDDRWFSHRGLPELIEDLVKEIDTQHCQKLDVQTMRNTPMITYRAGMVNPNLIKFMSTQAIPRHDADDITIMNNTNLNAEFSYEKEQMILESKIEELVGQIDFTLQSMINKRQPRTLGEVDYQVQAQQTVFSLDAELYIMSFSELFSQVYDLWCQYGDDEYEFSYFGDNGLERIKITKEEMQGKYRLTVRGNDQNYNPRARQAKAEFMLNAISNPVALQSGIVQPVNIFNAYKRLFQVMDEPMWNEYITDPTKIPQKNPPLPVKISMDNLTPQEKAQVKASQGIQPDINGMRLEKQEEFHDKLQGALKNVRPERPDRP